MSHPRLLSTTPAPGGGRRYQKKYPPGGIGRGSVQKLANNELDNNYTKNLSYNIPGKFKYL